MKTRYETEAQGSSEMAHKKHTDLYNIRCFLSPQFWYPFLFEAALSVFVAT